MANQKSVAKVWINGRPVEMRGQGRFEVDAERRTWTFSAEIPEGPHNRVLRLSAVTEDGTRVYGRARITVAPGDDLVTLEGIDWPEIIEGRASRHVR